MEQAENKERKKEKGNASRRHGQNNDFEGNSWETDPRKGKRDDSLAIMGKRRERGEKISGNAEQRIQRYVRIVKG